MHLLTATYIINNLSNQINKKNTANIVLSNLDSLTQNTLAYFINSNLCQNARLALSKKNIHIYILDLDRKYDDTIFKKAILLKQYIIGIYINEKELPKSDQIILVKKPLNVAELKDAIDSAHKEIFKQTQVTPPISNSIATPESKIKHKDQTHRNLYNAIDDENIEDDIHLRYKAQRYVGNNKDINPKTDDLKKIYIQPEIYFYTHLIKAIKMAKSNNSNTIIKTSLGNIIFHYQENTLNHNIDKNKLKLLQTTPLIHPVSISFAKSSNFKKEHSLNASSFVWDTSIRTSKGRLPEFTSLTNPVLMSFWPNFSQLKIFRHSIPIAAAWSRQRISLIETASLLKIPQRYVFSLYCAMNALGYAKIADSQNPESDELYQAKNRNSASSTLFNRILTHIFKRK